MLTITSGAISAAQLLDRARLVRIPVYLQHLSYQISHGLDPSGVDPQQLARLAQAAPLIDHYPHQEDDPCLGVRLSDLAVAPPSPEPSPFEGVDVTALLSHLDPRSRLIVQLRCGLAGVRPHTCREVGLFLDRSPQSVSYQFRRVLDRLRELFDPNHLPTQEEHPRDIDIPS